MNCSQNERQTIEKDPHSATNSSVKPTNMTSPKCSIVKVVKVTPKCHQGKATFFDQSLIAVELCNVLEMCPSSVQKVAEPALGKATYFDPDSEEYASQSLLLHFLLIVMGLR